MIPAHAREPTYRLDHHPEELAAACSSEESRCNALTVSSPSLPDRET
jgi:hypothetical protein